MSGGAGGGSSLGSRNDLGGTGGGTSSEPSLLPDVASALAVDGSSLESSSSKPVSTISLSQSVDRLIHGSGGAGRSKTDRSGRLAARTGAGLESVASMASEVPATTTRLRSIKNPNERRRNATLISSTEWNERLELTNRETKDIQAS